MEGLGSLLQLSSKRLSKPVLIIGKNLYVVECLKKPLNEPSKEAYSAPLNPR